MMLARADDGEGEDARRAVRKEVKDLLTAIAADRSARAGDCAMARVGIEPTTPRFSVVCSTN